MSFTIKRIILGLNNTFLIKNTSAAACRCASSLPNPSTKYSDDKKQSLDIKARRISPEVRHIFPEFVPDPDPKMRNKLRERLERADMLARRSVIDIPEFYVGSVLAVTTSDPHAQNKSNRFVGLCIKRIGVGLRAEFTLRNVIDHQGIEVRYQLYDPTLRQIQVLRLEKRLDDRLYYLRDADPKHCTFPLDMEPEMLPQGGEVPVNDIKVELKPRPWVQKWWLHDLKGVEGIDKQVRWRERQRAKITLKPFLKYDLMKHYRETVPEEEQQEIWGEVHARLDQMQSLRKGTQRNKTFLFPKKTG